jgi:hypothetical protein
VQTLLLAGPKNAIAQSIRKVNFARFGGSHQAGVFELEAGIVLPDNVIMLHGAPKRIDIRDATRND